MEENKPLDSNQEKSSPLKRGWTTGACATAAVKAALTAFFTKSFPDPVTITLPKGQTPSFALAYESLGDDFASASIIKDAGDDPDVTHGALISAKVEPNLSNQGLKFLAGDGVGMVTKDGLPIPKGEPAINPVPRKMIQGEVEELCREQQCKADFIITISIKNGESLAQKTWNPRLGILGGLSILGTTGIVNPYSCSAWIHSIHRGIDVARANDLNHVVGSTGSTSEKAAQILFDLPDYAYLDMGDFAGGVLKYLRAHPVPRLTLTGGFAKFCKLAQGAMDLHSSRSQVDFQVLASWVNDEKLAEKILKSNTGLEVLQHCKAHDFDMPGLVAKKAQEKATKMLKDAPVSVDVMVIDRKGVLLSHVF
jgi:cobalt-precorrin-5B (C1)-methyltransferase